jgi:hypothetical protein
LLNDPAFVEIAQGLAARLLRECPEPATDRVRLQHAVRLCLGRTASSRELEALESVLRQERTEPAAPEKPAAWVTVARVLLNLDEFVTRE